MWIFNPFFTFAKIFLISSCSIHPIRRKIVKKLACEFFPPFHVCQEFLQTPFQHYNRHCVCRLDKFAKRIRDGSQIIKFTPTHFYLSPTELRKGNVFRWVCLSLLPNISEMEAKSLLSHLYIVTTRQRSCGKVKLSVGCVCVSFWLFVCSQERSPCDRIGKGPLVWPLCDDAGDTVLNENNGIAPEWYCNPFSSDPIDFNENRIASVIAELSQHWCQRLV